MKNKGQSVVEYILLLSVITFITLTIMRSDFLKKSIGPEGNVTAAIKKMFEHSYRHGYLDHIDRVTKRPGALPGPGKKGDHGSYVNDKGESRFYGPAVQYPGN